MARAQTRPQRKTMPSARPRRRPQKRDGVRWGRMLTVIVLGCILAIGGVVLLEGMGYLRDIERAENLVLSGWAAVAAISILITLAARMLRRK